MRASAIFSVATDLSPLQLAQAHCLTSLAGDKVDQKDLLLQVPTWARAMGYRQAACSQLARMSALPVLHFSGAQFAVKELSDATALKARSLPVRPLLADRLL